jgi:hypothetical protein
MELVPAKPAPSGSFPQFVRTDSEGRYELKLVPAGRYLLGVRIYGSAGSTYVPYRRTYYPGVFDESQATVINIAEGQVIDAVDLHLPPPLIERKLEGLVAWPDDQPVKGATVWLKEIEYPNNDMPYRATTDDQGRFSFKVYEGMKYSLFATVDSETKGKQKRSDTLEIRITENPEILKLIIARTAHEKDADERQLRARTLTTQLGNGMITGMEIDLWRPILKRTQSKSSVCCPKISKRWS